MTPTEAAQAATDPRKPYRFQVGPRVLEHDPLTGRTYEVERRPLLKDGKQWTKTEEGWVRK